MFPVCSLSPELQKVAREELNEVEKEIPNYIEILRDWIEKQPHLNARTDEKFLLTFLRGSKYRLEKAKSKIDNFYTFKTLMPESFSNYKTNEDVFEICRAGAFLSLPKPLGPAGPRLHLTICKNINLDKYLMTDFYRFECMWLESQIFDDPSYNISGFIEIYDLAMMSVKFFSHFDFAAAKKFGIFGQKASPVRCRGIHLVNCPKEAYVVFNLIKNLINNKLQTRIHMHRTFEDLYEFIPLDYLPFEYGGSNGSIEKIKANQEECLSKYNFTQDENNGVKEELRPSSNYIDRQSLFGLEGSFKKINID